LIKAVLNKDIEVFEYLSMWVCTFPFIVGSCSFD
jgi:hypothetical protein